MKIPFLSKLLANSLAVKKIKWAFSPDVTHLNIHTKTGGGVATVTKTWFGRVTVDNLPVGVTRKDVLATMKRAQKDIAEMDNTPLYTPQS